MISRTTATRTSRIIFFMSCSCAHYPHDGKAVASAIPTHAIRQCP
jgi:hypothetical protein